jgi:hypothetical protein
VTHNEHDISTPSHPVVEAAQKELSLSILDLRRLCESVDSAALFSAMSVFLGAPDSRMPINALHLIPAKLHILLYVASESFGKPRDCIITEQHIARCIRSLDAAYSAQRTILCGPYFGASGMPQAESFLLSSLAIETSMGVGAAEIDQTASLIRNTQGRFDKRFASRLGISPTMAVEVLECIARVQGSGPRLALLKRASDVWQRGWVGATDAEDVGAFVQLGNDPFLTASDLVVLPVSKYDVQKVCAVSGSEWNALLSLIGCGSDRRSKLQHQLDVINFPLPVFSDDRVFMINLANCLHRTFECFDADAKSDQSFASGKYQQHISDYLEASAATCLERLFPRDSVFRRLIYPDPHSNDGGSAELDIAVAWPPFLLICEAKSKQLRFSPMGADVARFCTDVKSNIEDGFAQARRFAKYVEGVDEIALVEKGGGRTLQIAKVDLRELFAVSISLRRFVSLAGQLPTLREMGLFKDRRFPWAVALDDLDLITRFSPSPDVFLHFIKRRIMLEKEEVRYAGGEVDFFGVYLNSGRLEPEPWRNMEKRPDLITMTEYHERFREAIQQERKGMPTLAPIPLRVPSIIKDFLGELSLRSSDPQARWIAFCLLSLGDEQLSALAYAILALKSSSTSGGRIRSAVLKCKDVVFSLTLSEERDLRQLHDITLSRAISEKYRTRADKCAAFGMEMHNSQQSFAHAFWIEEAWRPDPQLEEHVLQMKTRCSPLLPPGSKMPGRNEKCPCGSGKKFKYCCLGKYHKSDFAS